MLKICKIGIFFNMKFICYDMRSVYEVAAATGINVKRLYQGYSNLDILCAFLSSMGNYIKLYKFI